jgi:membrane protein YdbS with pleckstrin-like domain
MFESRTKKERTIIYAFIALIVAVILGLMHYYVMKNPIGLVLIIGFIEYVVIFYILYLPLKYKSN